MSVENLRISHRTNNVERVQMALADGANGHEIDVQATPYRKELIVRHSQTPFIHAIPVFPSLSSIVEQIPRWNKVVLDVKGWLNPPTSAVMKTVGSLLDEGRDVAVTGGTPRLLDQVGRDFPEAERYYTYGSQRDEIFLWRSRNNIEALSVRADHFERAAKVFPDAKLIPWDIPQSEEWFFSSKAHGIIYDSYLDKR